MALFGGLFEGPANSIPRPNPWTANPNDMASASSGALGGIGNLSNFNTAGQTLGQYGDITQNLVNNPFSSPMITGAMYGGGMAQQGATNQFQGGNELYGAGGAALNAAFDPRGALYARTQQQLQDQTRAGLGARGLAMTPWGAGVENKAMSDFNIDWQNQQLQRMLQGVSGAGNAFGQAAGMQNAAPIQYTQGSAMPYNAFKAAGTGQQTALQNLGQFGQMASQIPQQSIQDYLNYISQGNNAGQVANQNFANQLKQSELASKQQSDMWGGIGKIAGTVAPYAMMAFSDIRLKEDVEPVGELYDGQPLYKYRYRGDPEPRIGLMAHEVERVRPDAVFEVGGFKAVDYVRATERSRALASGAGAFSRW